MIKKWFKKHSNEMEIVVFFMLFVMILIECTLLTIKHTAEFYHIDASPLISVLYWFIFVLWVSCLAGYIALKRYNNKHRKRKVNTHIISANIVDEFEELLDTFDITIPDKEREGGKDEARLYGRTYDVLLENVEMRVISAIHEATDEDKVEIISDRF